MSPRRPTNAPTRVEQAASTRAALITAARRLWGEQGFFATSTSDIVEAAQAGTRGAFYHHFSDREELFIAVFDAVHLELNEAVAPQLSAGGDPLDRLRDVLLAFLDEVTDRPDVRALMVDGPAVFGWKRWREMEEERSVAGIEASLTKAAAAGVIADAPTRPMATILLGLVNDAGMAIASADDRAVARAEIGAAFTRLVDGLRAQ